MKKTSITLFNFGLLFSLIFGLNLNTDRGLNQYFNNQNLEKGSAFEYNQLADLEESKADEELEELGIELHPGSEFMPGSDGTPRSLNHCKSLVYQTLKSLPEEPVNRLKHLTLYFSDEGRRGLGGGNTVILRCQNVTDEELVAVLVHEMGHVMDTGVMNGSYESGASAYTDGGNRVYLNDASVEYYDISWEREDKLKVGVSKYDFVSGYAMSDPFEDFAESYAYYILHGTEFRTLAEQNETIEEKYEFFKNQVFNGMEYENGREAREVKTGMRHYDVTVLPYDLDKFFIS